MRRRMLVGLFVVAALALSSAAIFADDSFLATPHIRMGPQYHKKLVVRSDLKGAAGKVAPPSFSPTKEIPVAESSSALPKNTLGRQNSGTVMMATATPEMMLENRLRSLALELR